MKVDLLNFINLKDWEIKFCSFLDNKYTLLQFEDYIYKTLDIEDSIGIDLYSNLLNFNYKIENNEEEIKSFIRKQVFNDNRDVFYKYKTYYLIEKSGLELDKLNFENSENLPEYLLKIYGGREIGEIGSGIEQAKSNIVFMEHPLNSDLDSKWEKVIGNVVQIGMAHNQNIILFMNNEGVFYMYIDSIDKMYLGGSFQETLTKLLLGLEYGESITI